MSKPLFSICIPTHRPLAQTRRSIQSAYDYCKRNNYGLSVSDSSQDEDKRAWLKELLQGPNMTHIDSPPCGMIQNWSQAFNATTTTFVMIMGDDDAIFEYDDGPDYSNIPDDIAGVRPSILSYHKQSGIYRSFNAPISSEHGAQRVVEYIGRAQGANAGVICFWRRSVLAPVMDLWFHHHPTKGNYCDWAVMSALSSAGKIISHPTVSYFYNAHNWYGDTQHIRSQVEKSYALGGLHPGAAAYERIFNALDSYIFTNFTASPLTYEDRFIAAVYSMNTYLEPYLKTPYESRNDSSNKHPNAKKIDELCRSLHGLDAVPDILNILIEIMEAIQPGLADRYRAFHKTATGREWDTF